jgi:2-keto-4-pentenoate hydratase/2-oxohepta-3-ene-1,7-dioic acid hydratase in catechol pathway
LDVLLRCRSLGAEQGAAGTVTGPDDPVLIRRSSVRTGYEIELAVVIGRTARYLSTPEAADDVTERGLPHEKGGQWDEGRSCETFNPLGPWLEAPGQVGDPQGLTMRLWVNGELCQRVPVSAGR